MFHIESVHDGRRLVAPIAIRPPDAGTNLEHFAGTALVDTGATNSGIKAGVAQRLSLLGTGKRPMNGVHGEAHVQRYVFQIGLMPDALDERPVMPFYFEEIDGFELKDSFTYDALIGMDILVQCGLQMNRDRKWRLSFGHFS